MIKTLCLFAVAISGLSASTIHPLGDADIPSILSVGGVSDSYRSWRFQANANLTVSELGGNTPHPNGDPFSITLWDFGTQTKLAQLDFVSDGTNNWQWQDLSSPVYLTAGNQYLIGMFTLSPYYYFGFAPSSLQPTGNVQYLDIRYANLATDNTFPTNSLSGYMYGVPDFGYELTDASVPEPGTVFLTLAGGLALLVSRRKTVNPA